MSSADCLSEASEIPF